MTSTQNELNAEEWKEIPGFHGLYIISNQGIVRSVDRDKYDSWHPKGKRFVAGHVMKPVKNNTAVRLRNYKNGLIQYKRIKILMREVWGVVDFEFKQTAQDGE